MLFVKNYKFIKVFKRTSKNKKREFKLSNHIFFGIIASNYGILTASKYELLRRFFIQKLNKNCKINFKSPLTRPLTKKAEKSRMGKGKGNLDIWYTYIKPGMLLLEISTYAQKININKQDLRYLNSKINFSCKIFILRYQFKFDQLTNYPFFLKKL